MLGCSLLTGAGLKAHIMNYASCSKPQPKLRRRRHLASRALGQARFVSPWDTDIKREPFSNYT